jgi:HEAT repeat protein
MNHRTIPSPESKVLGLGAALAGAALTAAGQDSAAVAKLVADLQSPDDAVRGAAWQGAAPLGAPAVKPLAGVMAHADFEIARAAKRALWKVVRHAGRPKADQARKAVETELLALLNTAVLRVRREVVWMLSEIGEAAAVSALAKLLVEVEIREDARCALERIPRPQAVRALEQAFKTAPEDFRPALTNSLRLRGRTVPGYPTRKLSPMKPTAIQAK